MKINEQLWAFAGLDVFYERFAPDSVYGKAQRGERFFYADMGALTAEYDRIESAINFVVTHPDKVETVRDALARLTEIPHAAPQYVGSADVFLVKKFLVNFARIAKALPHSTSAEFGVDFASGDLLNFLRQSDAQDGDESFYLTEKFSEDLAAVRKEIRALDSRDKFLREKHFDTVLSEYGIDFRFRDFVVLAADKARGLPSGVFVLEPFDSHNFVVRPVLSRELLNLAVEREVLLTRERVQETKVYEVIAQKIALEFPLLRDYERAAARLDVALAKARLALEFGMIRPSLSTNQNFAVCEGRYLPLANRCAVEDLRYWPLTLTLEKNSNVVFGSNMGGKTVVLRSIAFFQTLAQMGFFVPADSFSSNIFSEISYVGAPPTGVTVKAEEGLSGFGQEIFDFSTAWEKVEKPSLILIDEFARTTNSVEASALLGAVLELFSEQRDVVGVVSTHFMDISIPNNRCGFFRMKGLNQNAFAQSVGEHGKGSETLLERIHRVNRFMQYEVVPEQGLVPARDALAIAEVLGLSPIIVEKAKRHMGEKYGR